MNLQVKGNYAEFITLTLKSKGVDVDTQQVQDSLKNLKEVNSNVAANALIGSLCIQDNENKEIFQVLQTVLDGIDNSDGSTDGEMSAEQVESVAEVSLDSIISKDENKELYNAITQAAIDFEKEEAQSKQQEIQDGEEAETKDISALPELNIEVSDSNLTWATNSKEMPDELTLSSDGRYIGPDGKTKYGKIAPRFMTQFEGRDIKVDGEKLLNADGDIVGYVHENTDGSYSYYMRNN